MARFRITSIKSPYRVNPLILRRKIDSLERENRKLMALLNLTKKANEIMPMNLAKRNIGDRNIRLKILKEVEVAARSASVSESIELIGLSRSRYKRWF